MWLYQLGAEITGFALPPPTRPSLFELAQVAKTQNWVQGDIRDLASVKAVVDQARPEIVFHLAAQPLVRTSYLDPIETYGTNVMGTVNLLEAVRTNEHVRGVVNVTTDKCYENREWVWGYREDEPLGGYDPYSSSKGCSELVTAAYRRSFFSPSSYGKSHQTAVATARAGNVIGGGDFAADRLIPDILKAAQGGEKVRIRNPLSVRPWQHVLEPLSGYLCLAQRLYADGPDFAEAWNFGPRDTDAKTVEWIAKLMTDLVPGARGYEIERTNQVHEANYLKLDISKAASRLNWHPCWGLNTALARIVDWDASSARLSCERQIATYELDRDRG